MNTIKKIINAVTPYGRGISSGHLTAAIFFGITYYAITEVMIFTEESLSLWTILANFLAGFLVAVAASYIAESIQATQVGLKRVDKKHEALMRAIMDTFEEMDRVEKQKAEAAAEAAKKKCKCGLAWEHTGKHAPKAKK